MMPSRKILIKVSGDQFTNLDFIEWAAQLSNQSYVSICVGGGTQINEEFRRYGWKPSIYGPMGREVRSKEEGRFVREVLEINKDQLENLLAERGAYPLVVIPVLEIGGVLCHMDADQYLINGYLGFDELYVVTLKERVEQKTQKFAHLPKIEIKVF